MSGKGGGCQIDVSGTVYKRSELMYRETHLSEPSDLSQRTPEKPCLNDVSDVGTWRRAALIASVFLVVLTLIPLWDELAEELGVGLVTSF
jgi:hypothetical protein